MLYQTTKNDLIDFDYFSIDPSSQTRFYQMDFVAGISPLSIALPQLPDLELLTLHQFGNLDEKGDDSGLRLSFDSFLVCFASMSLAGSVKLVRD